MLFDSCWKSVCLSLCVLIYFDIAKKLWKLFKKRVDRWMRHARISDCFPFHLTRCYVWLAGSPGGSGITLDLARSPPSCLFSGAPLGSFHGIYLTLLDGTARSASLKTVHRETTNISWIRSKIIIQSQHKLADWVPLATTKGDKRILFSFCYLGFWAHPCGLLWVSVFLGLLGRRLWGRCCIR